MSNDCSRLSALITGYIDCELPDSEQSEVKAHLADCESCKQAYLDELRIKRTVRERIPIYETPVALQRRIRRQIARSESKPGFWQLLHPIFVYRPLVASMSVAILALLLLVPIYQNLGQDEDPFSTSPNMELRGQIICLDCDVFSAKGEATVMHRAGIITEDRHIWTFVNAIKFDHLLHRDNLSTRRARVTGDLFHDARYVFVKKYELL